MKRLSNIFLSIIVLLAYVLCAPFVSAADSVSPNRGDELSGAVGKKDKEMRLADLPAKAREQISQHLRKAEYDVSKFEKALPSGKDSAYRAFNRNQNLSAYFTNQGVHVLPTGQGEPAWHLEMTLSGYGFDGAMAPVRPVQPDTIKVSGHRIEYRRGKITEWYVNDRRGIEQGVTLSEPPGGKKADLLMVEWTVSSSLKPRLEQEGTAIAFCKTGDQSVLRYSGLKAWDATGRSLPAKLDVRSNGPKDQRFRIAYVIDAADASYPVMIDPLFTQIKKILPKGAAYDYFGISVSISGDTVVVGAYEDDDNGTESGSAYIFDRHQGGTDNWGQVAKITASDGEAYNYFGISVSISGDTVVVGAHGDDYNGYWSGSAYIFDRDQGGTDNWGQVKKITASDGAPQDNFGLSVSISGDTVVVGAYYDDSASGSAYIFDRDQGGTDNWGQVQKITASDGAASDFFGRSVSISGDTVVVGAIYGDNNASYSGSAYIFDRDQGGTDNWGQVQEITALDGAADDNFGRSVSISGDTVVVGAYSDDDDGSASGSAYIFDRHQGGTDNWGQVQKITASDGALGDYFGLSVSISGDTVVVGAYYDDSASGSAYIFDRDQGGTDNWGQVTKITASDGAASDFFGRSVSISGDTVVVGAYGDDDNGTNTGSAYIFDRDEGGTDNWGQVQKITASGGGADHYFGRSVSISGDTLVVGAYGDDDNGIESGSAYIFNRDEGGTDNWDQVQKITALDGAVDDNFGFSVFISGDTVIVGAYGDDDNGTDSGSAYIFDRHQGGTDNWGQVTKITALDGAADDRFGYSVSISGDWVVVGALFDDDNGTNSGSVYFFYRDYPFTDNWGLWWKITASDGAAYDYFGKTVSISGDTVVVGAHFDDDDGSGSGSAYIFYRNPTTDYWGQVMKITASDGARSDWFGGSVSISGDTVVVGASGDDDNGSGSGSAYIFDRDQGGTDNWGQVQKITASDGAVLDYFGGSVFISGDTVVSGAYYDDDNGPDSGSAYIFDRDLGGYNNWGQVQKITVSDGAADDYFGISVSISGDTVVVGAYGDDDNGSGSGSAYVFESVWVKPVIDDIVFYECISELCTSAISVTASDPEGGDLTYTYDTPDGGDIIGEGSDVEFDPPDTGPHACPYQIEVTVTSDVSGLSTSETIDIYVKLAGDADGNGVVNVLDKVQVRNHFGESGSPGWIDADVDCNGVVNVVDKVIVRNQFGQTGCSCPLFP